MEERESGYWEKPADQTLSQLYADIFLLCFIIVHAVTVVLICPLSPPAPQPAPPLPQVIPPPLSMGP